MQDSDPRRPEFVCPELTVSSCIWSNLDGFPQLRLFKELSTTGTFILHSLSIELHLKVSELAFKLKDLLKLEVMN